MQKITTCSLPAALAFFVITAHPQGASEGSSGIPEKRSTSAAATATQLNSQGERNQASTFNPQPISEYQLKKTVTDVNKASSFTRMSVQNMQNEKLGTVQDLVFDPETGKISYAVISVGGVLGVGDKLVAVPLTSLRPQPGQNYLVLNMSRDELKSAPGLAKNNWPHLNDPALGSGSPGSRETSSATSGDAARSSDASSSGLQSSPSSSSGTPDNSKSSDKLSSGGANRSYGTSAQPNSSTSSSTATSRGKDAQGSNPSNSTGSNSDNSSTENSGKDAGGAPDPAKSTGSNSDSGSSNPKP